ncbi:MAG: hypothetical protein M1419_07655, partial [Bacteroidetes bacterium]|nr:hypothetical protein [Bacteroidota bacterium]
MKRIIVFITAIIILSINPALSQWTECNNGMYGGMTSCFVIKDTYLFAGSIGGLYRSSNNGTNWEHIYNGLPQYPVRSLIVVGNSIFAGTFGGGFYTTSDNGASWNASNTGLTNLSMLSLLLKG